MAYYGKGNNGQILRDNSAPNQSSWTTATYPSTAGTSGNLLTSDGTNFVSTTPPSGTIVGSTRTSTTTPTSTATNLASTAGTTPTTSNTTSFLTLSYTPKSTSNRLKFEFSCTYSCTTTVGFFLFSGTTLIASFGYPPIASVANPFTATFTAFSTPASTSSISYAIYYACTSGTVFLLENSSSTSYYNATATAYFQITEIIT